jgi:hypothetical protein
LNQREVRTRAASAARSTYEVLMQGSRASKKGL